MKSKNNNLLGIFFMILSMFSLSVNDIIGSSKEEEQQDTLTLLVGV